MNALPEKESEKRCDSCRAEVNSDDVCKKCGNENRPREVVEIEFKQFKISELLDIKLEPRSGRREQEKK